MDVSLISLEPTAQIVDALRVLDSSAAQIVLVVDQNHRLLGTVTDGDIRRGLLQGVDLQTPVSKVMNVTPKVLRPGDSAAMGRAAMLRYTLHHMPVVDDEGRVLSLRFLSDPRTGEFADIPVVLMAGGLGQRLQPHTDDTPKPMLMLGGKPILEHILQRFIDQGFRRFFISVNYLGHVIEGYFGDGSQWDVTIEYLREDRRLGTAGALTLLPPDQGSTLVVMNGDLITGADFREIVHAHLEMSAAATMCLREHRTAIPFGVVDAEGDMFQRVREKPTITQSINAGIYCLEENALELIPSDQFYDMPSLFEALAEESERCGVFRLQNVPWLDIGTPKDLERAQASYDVADTSPKEAARGNGKRSSATLPK